MAITSTLITIFKKELLEATHNFKASGGNTFKLALYTDSSVIGPSLASFTTAGQVTDSTGDYSSGGKVLQGQTHKLSGTTAIVDFAELSFTGVTLTARVSIIYNTSNSNKAVAVLDFGGDKTATAGTFTIQFPTFNSSNAILRIS